MESDDPGGAAALPWTDSGWPAARGKPAADSAAAAVEALYQHHAVGLIRLDDLMWRGAIITPDGRTVVIVEELAGNSASVKVRDRLLKVSVATGRVTVVSGAAQRGRPRGASCAGTATRRSRGTGT